MLRIGEAAKRFGISNRTLRYWEEMGILTSTRTDNDYRFYDGENAARIGQIAMLRKLRMPIADIERMFLADDPGAAIDALAGHLEALKREAADADTLARIIGSLIGYIRQARDLGQVFALLETRHTALEESMAASQNILSERVFTVSEQKSTNVRIVRLPAMTVASYLAESASPEEDCGKVFVPFVLDNGLHKRDGFRNFGFNNPSPSEGNPVYGYEMWVTIPEDFDVPAPLVKKQFGGGLYASIPTFMNEIGERWQALYSWCKDSEKYEVDVSHQFLEECSMDFQTFTSDDMPDNEKQLDLLEPIRMR